MKGFYKRAFLLSVIVVVVLVCFLRFPRDDGLRHVGLAFSELESESNTLSAVSRTWGTTYPFSYFEVLKGYDPWFGYDLILRIIATGLKCLPISDLLAQFLFTQILSIIFSISFFYLTLQRSHILDDIRDQDTFVLVYALLLLITTQTFLRMLSIRPFVFGTLFLIYAIGQKGILRGVLSSAAISFFYPYLAWFYTIPVAAAHFLKGDRRFALGTISLTLFFLYLQPSSFWGFQLAVFKSDLVRATLNPKITEFFSGFNSLLFIYLAGFLILYPSFSERVKKLNFANLIIILFLIPSFKYIRYFVDLVLPVFFVAYGRELLTVLLEPYRKFISYWGNTLRNALRKLKPSSIQTSRRKAEPNLKPYIVVLYVLVAIIVIQSNRQELISLRRFQSGLSVIPAAATVLTYFNLQYKVLYVRPDLRIIPSCEIGFPEDRIRKEYQDFLNQGEVVHLARKTKAEFFLENKRMYIDPEDGKFLKLAKKTNDLRIWKVLHPSESSTPSIKKK
jgi:hypothetical protein